MPLKRVDRSEGTPRVKISPGANALGGIARYNFEMLENGVHMCQTFEKIEDTFPIFACHRNPTETAGMAAQHFTYGRDAGHYME